VNEVEYFFKCFPDIDTTQNIWSELNRLSALKFSGRASPSDDWEEFVITTPKYEKDTTTPWQTFYSGDIPVKFRPAGSEMKVELANCPRISGFQMFYQRVSSLILEEGDEGEEDDPVGGPYNRFQAVIDQLVALELDHTEYDLSTFRVELNDTLCKEQSTIIPLMNTMMKTQTFGSKANYLEFTSADKTYNDFLKLELGGTAGLTFRVVRMTPNVKIFTGFYDNPPSEPHKYYASLDAASVPMPYFGRAFYLKSCEGNVIHSAYVQNPSVLFRINEFIKEGIPLIVKPYKDQRDDVIADGTSLRKIELELVNRWMQPVRLQNPMIVTIKMEPILEDVVTYG
jgi:hypothetical protein